MEPQILPLISCILAFFLGSIPFGLIFVRLFKGADVREGGSGNIGATNVARTAGKGVAILTLLFDMGKGALALVISLPESLSWWPNVFEVNFSSSEVSLLWAIGFFSVLGHCYTPWLQFKGGKGVATGFGVLLVLSPLSALAGVLAYILAFQMRRIGSLASLTGLFVAAFVHWVVHPVGLYLWPAIGIMGAIIIRHEENVDQLLGDAESSF